MKRIFFFALLLAALAATIPFFQPAAQVGQSAREWKGASAPSGSCTTGVPPVIYQGSTYYCSSGSWMAGAAGGGGSSQFTTAQLTNDGVTDIRAGLNTLINTTMQPNGGELIVTPGIFLIGSNLDWPANVRISYSSTGYLKIATGAVLNQLSAPPNIPIQYYVNVGPSQGRVNFTRSYKVVTVYGEWFGADADADSSGEYTQNWRSFQAAEWAAFGKVVSLTAATNASPVQFSYEGGYVTGQTVSIEGGTGNWANASGTWTVTVTSPTTFTIPLDTTTFGAVAGTLIASDRTNPAGGSKYNREIGLLGNYRIAGTLQFYSVNGGQIRGLNKKDCGFTQMTADTPIINGQSWDYFTVDGVLFAAGATQASNPLINIDYTGPPAFFNDLRPQNVTFKDCKFLGQVNGTQGAFMGVWVARNGGGSQGDNIRFLFCYGSWFTHSVVTLGGNNTAPLTSSGYATNALGVQWIGGDIQFCPKYGLASYGGYWNIDGPTTENQCADGVGFPAQTGADFHFEGGSVLSTVANVRSESLRVIEGPANLRNVKQVNATFPTAWYDSNFQSSVSGTQAYVGQLVTGTLAGGNGKAYKVTRADSSVSGFIFMTSLPGAFTIADSTASYTVNEHVGKVLQVKYASNGFEQSIGTITSNTATTITYTGAVDTTNFTAPGSTKYQIVHSSPFWDGLPKFTATSGSGTGAGATVTKTSAGWTVNAHTGWIASIVLGTGITQKCKIASNTADTLTCDSNGWTTSYPLDYLHPSYAIVAADNTSQVAVEPEWDVMTTSGSDIEWEAFDYAAIDGYIPGSTYHTGTIHDVITTVGALVKTASTDIQSLQVSRADWGSQINLFNDGRVEYYWKDIRVIRERGYVKPLPWVPARNGSTAPLAPTANVFTFGSACLAWNRGLFGGGPALTDLYLCPGDGANANSSTNKDILAFGGGLFGKRSARGLNQTGIDFGIGGGPGTGTGAGGSFNIYHFPAGSSGVAENTRVLAAGVGGANGLFWSLKGANVASASTITPSGNYFHITGTTTITSLSSTNITAGTEVTMIFDGACQVTSGGTLALKGNFVSVAGDTLTLRWDGTNWVEKARTSYATSTIAGLLNPTDWAAFSAKAPTATPTFTGDVTASNGNLILGAAGKTIQGKTGSNACYGSATLSSGTVTVSTTCTGTTWGTDFIIILTPKGSSTGALRVSTVTASTSFVITSSDAASADDVAWQIIKLN